MKVADAPTAGWYPDPEGGTRLRWWDGGDWTDDYRVRPTLHETAGVAVAAPASNEPRRRERSLACRGRPRIGQ